MSTQRFVAVSGDAHASIGDIQRLVDALRAQVLRLEQRVMELERSLQQVQYVAPTKVFEGMLRFADGSSWNPGAGRGLYQFVGGAWVKL